MEIQNTNGKYLIYEDGRIWSKYYNKFLVPVWQNRYFNYCLQVNNKNTTCSMHRLVALHYIPNPNNKPEVDHIDRNRTNNNVNNLRWVSKSEQNINRTRGKGKLPYRHIIPTRRKNGNDYWRIYIRRENMKPYQKSYNITKYSLEEVVRFRNEKYIELGIEIDDN